METPVPQKIRPEFLDRMSGNIGNFDPIKNTSDGTSLVDELYARKLGIALVAVAGFTALAGVNEVKAQDQGQYDPPTPEPIEQPKSTEDPAQAQPNEVEPSEKLPSFSKDKYDWRGVVLADFTNADIAPLKSSKYYQFISSHELHGKNIRLDSSNKYYRRSLNNILNGVQREFNPKIDKLPWHTIIPGDLVQGHWGVDYEKTGIFGRVRYQGPNQTKAERRKIQTDQKKAIFRAGSLYYGAAKARFTSRGLKLFVAVGDHEVGDNDMERRKGGIQRLRWNNYENYLDVFSRIMLKNKKSKHLFTNRPKGESNDVAYATMLSHNVKLITLNPFKKTPKNVVAELDDKQMDWLEKELDDHRARWKIVQLHTPIIGPVRHKYSSRMMYENGRKSRLWGVLSGKIGGNKADLVLPGEVHNISSQIKDGLTQATTGGLFTTGDTNYVTMTTKGKNLHLEVKDFKGCATVIPEHMRSRVTIGDRKLWQTNRKAYAPEWQVEYNSPVAYTVGKMTLRKRSAGNGSRVTLRRGLFRPIPHPRSSECDPSLKSDQLKQLQLAESLALAG